MSALPRPRVLYLWDADYPWDVRTEKVCRTLVEAGYDVDIVARNSRWEAEVEELPEGVVRRMSPWRWVGQRADRLLSFPFFGNPRWVVHLVRIMRARRPAVLIVRDLPLAPLAIWMARWFSIPVMIDMAENYAAMIRDVWDAGRAGCADVIVRNPAIIAAVERYVMPRMDHVITVVQESSDRVMALGVRADRVSVVSNTPSRGRVTRPGPKASGPSLRLVYLGLMEVPRGVLEVLDATAELVREGRAIELQLVGGGRDLDLFRAHATSLGLSAPRVVFHGTLPHAQALEVVGQADVGLVPHHATESWNTTIPNKLFDYMAAGLPVISSDAVPAARVVRETGAGLVHRSRDSASLAAQLRMLFDASERGRMAEAGRCAVRDRYNWEQDSRALLRAVTATAGAKPGS